MAKFLRAVTTALLALWPLAAPGLDCAADATTPAAVRGIGQEPLAAGETVTVRGRIGGVFLGEQRLDGFFLQARTDGKPAGVFVYAPEPEAAWDEALRPGRRVVVRARTDRFHGRIQLHRVAAVTDCGPATVAPVSLDWPAPPERLRTLNGVRVRLSRPLTVTGHHQLADYGSLHLAERRLFHPNTVPAGDPDSPTLVLDDGAYESDPRPVPYLGDAGTRRLGARVTALTGILTHAFDAWRIHPVTPPAFDTANPRPQPPETPDARARRVGLINLGNYFVSLDGRGARSKAARRRQEAALGRLVEGLAADALAVVELENRPRALTALVERVTGGAYRAVAGPARLGDDVIRNAILYRPERLEAVGPPRVARDPTFVRPPLAQRFRSAAGHAFTLVAAHFKSKGGCPETGEVDRGEGCWNPRREREARALARWTSDLPRPVILAGDLNAYAREAPISRLRRAGFRDLLRGHLTAAKRYTYVYRGRSGFLDHLMLRGEWPGLTVGHWAVNADEPRGVTDSGEVWRSTDHDPVWVDLPGRKE
jgi:hypothetical protein